MDPIVFRKEIENLINKNSMENGSNTPDFILAEYLSSCLKNFDTAVNNREKWYGRKLGQDGFDGAVDATGPFKIGR